MRSIYKKGKILKYFLIAVPPRNRLDAFVLDSNYKLWKLVGTQHCLFLTSSNEIEIKSCSSDANSQFKIGAYNRPLAILKKSSNRTIVLCIFECV